MSRFTDIDDAWRQGYADGWQEIKKSSIPHYPGRQGGIPPGVIDQNEYYYEKARALGHDSAMQANAGIINPQPTPPAQP